jgi:hypothetical protein
MAGSAADAISKAVERSKQLLFPFKAEKWFALGFTVFLAQCGETGGGGSIPNLPSGTGSPSSGSASPMSGLGKIFEDAVKAFYDDLALYLTIGTVVLVATFGLWGFILWFSSRAKLMFVESVIWDRVDFSAQWSRAADLGFSLFKFRLVFMLGGALLMLGVVAAALLLGMSSFLSGQFFDQAALMAYALVGFMIVFVSIPWAIAAALLDDFVVPLMVLRNVPVGDAWSMCRREVLSGNVGGLLVFYLLRFVLGLAAGVAVMVATCITCCLTAMPYIGTVILLPILVFSRAYPLYYLEQLGIAVFPAPAPEWVAYDQWRFPR